MALQGPGNRISFSDIRNEFGTPRNNNIGAYRVSETYGAMSNLPLDNGIPQSGRINWSDFYNKRLNLIIDCYSGGGSPTSSASFFWNSLDAAYTGVAEARFRVNDNGRPDGSGSKVKLISYGTPGATFNATIKVSWDDSSDQGRSFSRVHVNHNGGRYTFERDGTSGSDTKKLNFTVGQEYTVDIAGLDRGLGHAAQGDGLNDDVYEWSDHSCGTSSIPNGFETKRIGMRDDGGDDINGLIQILSESDHSGNVSRKSSERLFPFKKNPNSHSSLADRYGVSRYNARDAEFNRTQGGQVSSWRYDNVSFPDTGDYQVSLVADDTATVQIGPYILPAAIGGGNHTIRLTGGTYNIEVRNHTNISGNYVCQGNIHYFAMTISKQGVAPAPAGSALTNVGFKLRYNAGFRYRVGQFSGISGSIPSTDQTGGKKVIAHTNGLIYNTNGKGDQYKVALRTGIWPSDCDLHLNVGPNSLIIGAGGDGGRGGDGGGNGSAGQNGSSAIGILTPLTLVNNGEIRRGHGGGGGGHGASFTTERQECKTKKKGGKNPKSKTKCVTKYDKHKSSGGGGGGGAGFPNGNGGSAGGGVSGLQGSSGSGGGNGNTDGKAGGNGGNGGNRAGRGGNGGPPNRSNGSPGANMGENGWSLLFSSSSVQNGTSITNNGVIHRQNLYGIGFPKLQ
jgi:hypothetical protein